MKTKYFLIAIIFLAAILRLPGLDKYPPSLYSDEVSQGYNAYSVLKTGRDEYGSFLPVSFRSFGDWKPPLPTYAMLPTIALFGLNAWGVRLPSVILGTLSVWLLFELVAELFLIEKLRSNRITGLKIALISALLLAISPWHILHSRSAMLVGVALFWLLLGVLSFFKGARNKGNWWLLSGLSFTAAIYSYYGMRLIVPLMLLGLLAVFFKEIWQQKSKAISSGILAVILLLPLLFSFIKESDVVFGRAKTVSIFYDAGVRLTVADLIAKDGFTFPPILVRIFHNKPFMYGTEIVRRFGEHVDGTFLFLRGDIYSPFQLPNMGLLYLTDVVLMILGIIFLLRRQSKVINYALFWLVITVLPAALTFVTPSSNRIFSSVVFFMLLSAAGIVWLVRKVKYKGTIIVISILYALQLAFFMWQFTVNLPLHHGKWWHYGNRELFAYLKTVENEYETINVLGDPSVIYIFKLFYEATPPEQMQTHIKRNYHADAYGFEHVDSYGKYQFFRSFDWQVDRERMLPNSLLVLPASVNAGSDMESNKQIYFPDGQVIYNIYKI